MTNKSIANIAADYLREEDEYFVTCVIIFSFGHMIYEKG